MSSTPALPPPTSKTTLSPFQNAPQAHPQSSAALTAEGSTSRRPGGSGSFGSGSQTRSGSATSRHSQTSRKQHRGQRKPRLADEDAAAESAAMQSTSNRKGRTSITHLMNFTLPPRPQYHPRHHFGRNNIKRNPTWGIGSGYHAADKARYISANYRFIVNPDGDYRDQTTDANIPLDWGNVLQILVSAQSQATNCPICLSKPVAPRMAKCGHIFCLPCLIRFMHSTDESQPFPERKARWKKCPICDDIMYVSETRPVRWFVGQEGERPQDGGDVVLRLMVRRHESTLALPRDGAEVTESPEEIPWYFAAEVMDYARIMKGSEEYMTEQHGEEIDELRQQEKEDELLFGEDSQWTNRAIASIHEAIEKAKSLANPPSILRAPAERKTRRPPIEFRNDSEDVPEYYGIQHAKRSGQSSSRGSIITQYERSGSTTAKTRKTQSSAETRASSVGEGSAISREPSTAPSAIAVTPPGPRPNKVALAFHNKRSESPFFFYEALLHFYLSSLDIKILRAAFGDYSSFPTTILPRVEHVSTGHIVDDELRRRAKYLAHLPYGCEVGFLECDWTDIVPPTILDQFTVEIERRRKKNQEKATREEKERVRAEREEEDKRWAAARRRRPSVGRDIHSEVHFVPLPEVASVDLTTSSSSPPWSSGREHRGSAFASLASPSTSPVTQKTVWGTRIAAPATPPSMTAQQDADVPEHDGWLQDWEAQLLREDEMMAQVESLRLEAGSSTPAGAGASGSSGGAGKKKKGKKITLMSTNVRRGA